MGVRSVHRYNHRDQRFKLSPFSLESNSQIKCYFLKPSAIQKYYIYLIFWKCVLHLYFPLQHLHPMLTFLLSHYFLSFYFQINLLTTLLSISFVINFNFSIKFSLSDYRFFSFLQVSYHFRFYP